MTAAVRYTEADRTRWDAFVDASKNGTFLLRRDYLDHHAHRFDDHSLLFVDERGGLVALLPAHRVDATFSSHDGLTYGGVVSGTDMTVPRMLEVFDALVEYLRGQGVAALRYKTIPWIHHRLPAEEDRYALFRHGAWLRRRDVWSVLGRDGRPPYQERRRRGVRRARAAGLATRHGAEASAFWPMLEATLRERHDATPVHTLAEIEHLAARFPDAIRVHLCVEGAEPLAGCLVFDTGRVARAQYIASTSRGREVGALDLLFDVLLNETYADRVWFDFGSSNEDEGRVLKLGLVEQKEGFGARAVVHDHYELRLP